MEPISGEPSGVVELPTQSGVPVDELVLDVAVDDATGLLDRIRVQRAGRQPLQPLDPTTYARDHAEFESRSDQRQRITANLLDRLGARGDGPISVLSVGCGDGSVDVALAASLTARHPRRPVRYVGVEPFGGSAEAFARRMAAVADAGASVHMHVATFDEALHAGLAEERFDVVMFVHSMYYVPDVAATVRAAYGLLLPGGELLVLSAPRGALNQLAGVLAPPIDGHRQWFSDDVSAGFRAAGFGGEPVETLHARVDLTDAGRDVLDFTVQARLTDDVAPLVSDYLSVVSVRPDALLVPHPVDVYLAERPR